MGAGAGWDFKGPFGLELDAMYHRMGYVAITRHFDSANGNLQDTAIDVKGDSWDFPLMVKYRRRISPRPFLRGGGVLRYVGPLRGLGERITGSLAGGTTTTRLDTRDPSELAKRLYPGLTAAAGLELRAGRAALLPEVRWTRWTANISGPGGLLRFPPNQLEFILALQLTLRH